MIKKRCLLKRNIAVLFLLTALLVALPSCRAESISTAAVEATPALSPGTPRSTHMLGDSQIRTRDEMTMVYVPAGQFEMGLSDTQVDQALRVCSEAQGDCERTGFRVQQPAHTVTLDAFWIDQTEVTNAMYAVFLTQQGNQVHTQPLSGKAGECGHNDRQRESDVSRHLERPKDW